MRDHIREVAEDEREALIAWLGDWPQTVASVDRLRRGTGQAWVMGEVEAPVATVVRYDEGSPWPAGFGEDGEAIFALLQQVQGWEAVHVPLAVGEAVATVMRRETGTAVALIEEPFYLPDGPVSAAPHPDVRMLTTADVPMMEAAEGALPGMEGWRLGSAVALVEEGLVCGAVTGGALVAVGFTSCWSDRYAEVGIATRPEAQGRGLATAAGALICTGIEAWGKTPVWSTSEENVASRRVAAKLGFREVSRRVYVNRG